MPSGPNPNGAGVSRPTVKVIIRRKANQQAPAATRYVTTSPSPPPLPSHPWDSHQDDVVVNTVENGQTARRTGVTHYLHQLSLRHDYEHIGTHPDEDARRRKREDEEADVEAEDDGGNDEGERVKQESHEDEDKEYDPRIDLTKAPIPASSSPSWTRQQYISKVYKATTKDAAVCLAIAQLVQRNLPYIDWTSALNHTPNLPPGGHAEAPPPQSDKAKGKAKITDRATNEDVFILFLPTFYHDGRHALGYYTTSPPKTPGAKEKRTTQILFSPCTSAQIQQYALFPSVQDAAGRGKGKGKAEKEEEWGDVQSLGKSPGRWIDCSVVEEYEEWREAVRVVESIWEKRLAQTGVADLGLEES